MQQQQQEQQQSRTGFDGIFQQRQQQPQQQQGFQRGGRKFTTDEPEQNFETSGRFTSRSDPRTSPIPTPSIQQGPLTLSNSNIRQLLQQLDVAGSQQCNLNVQAQWDFETNVNEGTQIRAVCSNEIVEIVIKVNYHTDYVQARPYQRYQLINIKYYI